jgi:hypothetical protein
LWCSSLVSSQPSTSPITHTGRGLMWTNYPLHIILDNFTGCNIPRIVSARFACDYNATTICVLRIDQMKDFLLIPSLNLHTYTYYGLASYLEHHLQGALVCASRSIGNASKIEY